MHVFGNFYQWSLTCWGFCWWKLAGVVAVEVTGGPEIPFHPGRPVSELESTLLLAASMRTNIAWYLCAIHSPLVLVLRFWWDVVFSVNASVNTYLIQFLTTPVVGIALYYSNIKACVFLQDKNEPPPEGRLPEATKGRSVLTPKILVKLVTADIISFNVTDVSFSFSFSFYWCFSASGTDHLREVFGHMGLSDKDIVALSGGHTLVSLRAETGLSTSHFNELLICMFVFSIFWKSTGQMPQGTLWVWGTMD